MKTDKVFIVNMTDGSHVITPRVIEKEIHAVYPKDAPKLKAKDVKSYAQDLTLELTGQAIDGDMFVRHIHQAIDVLSRFTILTPYNYGKMLN